MILRKYDEIMEKIVVTPEMKERVLGKINGEIRNKEKKMNLNKKKRYPFTGKTEKFEQNKKNTLKKRSFRSAWKYMTAACLAIAVATVWTVSRPYLPGSSGEPD